MNTNEWGKLKEVIVGSAVNSNILPIDISWKIFFHDNVHADLFGNDVYFRDRGIKRKYMDEHVEDIENFVDVLEKHNIKVLRPKPLKKLESIRTPNWKSITHPPLNIRDQALIFGNKIIETSCQIRSRYFENDSLKDIFNNKFMEGWHWLCSPRPTLTESSFKGKPEIMFDGAQCIKCDDSILFNGSILNHDLGFLWLANELPEYKWYYTDMTDNHIDSTVMPLRKGVVLVNPKKYKPDPIFKGWRVIEAPEPKEQKYELNDLKIASQMIDINVLPIGDDKIIVNEDYVELQELLYKWEFDPIPVKLRHRRLFGGGFHCITLDTIRL